jgi:hypothetical protein
VIIIILDDITILFKENSLLSHSLPFVLQSVPMIIYVHYTLGLRTHLYCTLYHSVLLFVMCSIRLIPLLVTKYSLSCVFPFSMCVHAQIASPHVSFYWLSGLMDSFPPLVYFPQSSWDSHGFLQIPPATCSPNIKGETHGVLLVRSFI